MLGNLWKLEECLPAVDVMYRNNQFDYFLGWENWFAKRTFALRAGGNADEADLGFGYVIDLGKSGVNLEIDYALLWPLQIQDTSGSHRISLTVRFAGCQEKAVPPPPPAPAPPPITFLPVREEERGLVVDLSSNIMFDFGKATVKGRSNMALNELVRLLEVYKSNKLIIEGHTDSIGTMIFNQRLSEARANAVATFLTQNGISKDRLEQVIGFGETKPIADNKTPEGRAENRRVEIIILKENPTK
jgi:outer membrane protein OmpA-like peptidoglycan-associated protein